MSREPSLQDPLRFNRKTPPCAVVIFGANGDLTKRKLMPALYRLAWEGRLAPGFAVVGISRTAMSDDDFRERMHDSVANSGRLAIRRRPLEILRAGPVLHGRRCCRSRPLYQRLADCLKEVEQSRQTAGNTLFYLSTQPSQYARDRRRSWARAGTRERRNGWRRIIIEKPFGHDLTSARAAERPGCRRFSTKARSTASITTSARKPSEHPRVSLRQRHFRAALEPALHRSRADHRRRIDRRGRPRRLLPGSGRAARHDPESSAAGDGDRLPWSPAPRSPPTPSATSAPNCCARSTL